MGIVAHANPTRDYRGMPALAFKRGSIYASDRRRSELVDKAVRATMGFMGINGWLALVVCHGLGERSDFVREVRENFREMCAR